MIISHIVAADENNAIGIDGGLPWNRLRSDMRHFKKTTLGHCVLMGRKTFESLGKPLAGRSNYVVSRNLDWNPMEIVSVNRSIDEALSGLLKTPEEVFIIGGGEIYRSTIAITDRIYLTRVHCQMERADTYYPDIDINEWELTNSEFHSRDEDNEYDYEFQLFTRKNN